MKANTIVRVHFVHKKNYDHFHTPEYILIITEVKR